MATEEGNMLTPVDAKVDCATGAVTQGVLVERIMAATEPARMKLVILDACRDVTSTPVWPIRARWASGLSLPVCDGAVRCAGGQFWCLF
jgi:hypothetical protein